MNDTGQPRTFDSNIYSTFTLLYVVTLQFQKTALTKYNIVKQYC